LPNRAGLGVHLTLDMAGQTKFGPDTQWLDSPDYTIDPHRADAFYAEVRDYWPELPDHSLSPGYTGIRPKITGPNTPAADFVIAGPAMHGIKNLIHLFGFESPGLTACLTIAQAVRAALDETPLDS
jgi:L-2-hydroxyglutarate oxidase LhgO